MLTHTFANQLLCTIMGLSICALNADEPTFHLKNKSDANIQVMVMQGNAMRSKGFQAIVRNGALELDNITSNSPTKIELNYCFGDTNCTQFVAHFTQGKTIYIKFDGKSITPQEGTFLSGRTKTTDGYSLKNNVTTDDIEVGTLEAPERGHLRLEHITRESNATRIPKARTPTSRQAISNKPTTYTPSEKSLPPLTPAPQLPENKLSPLEEAWQQFPEANALRKQGADLDGNNSLALAKAVFGVTNKPIATPVDFIMNVDEWRTLSGKKIQGKLLNNDMADVRDIISKIAEKAHKILKDNVGKVPVQ